MKKERNKNSKKFKIALFVLLVGGLAITTMRTAYAAFFSVKTLDTVQTIDTGNLDVAIVINNSNSIINATEEIYPVTDNDFDETNGYYSILTIKNNESGTTTDALKAEYSVTITYDYDSLRTALGDDTLTDAQLREDYLVSFDYLNIGVVYENNWVDFSDNGSVYYPVISSFTASNDDAYAYPILHDYISDNETQEYYIYVWLSDDTPTSEIGKYVYLKLSVKCAAGTETITEEVSM